MGCNKEKAIKAFKVFKDLTSACIAIACAMHAYCTHELDGAALTNASFFSAVNRLLRRWVSLFLFVAWIVSAVNTVTDCILPYVCRLFG